MNSNQNVQNIRKDMALTRGKIDETIQEISSKVGADSMKSVASAGIKHARHYVEGEAEEYLSAVSTQVEKFGRSSRGFISRHPLASTVIGVAIGLLLARAKTRSKPVLPNQRPRPASHINSEKEILI